jgi:hypothetical protein
MIGEMVDDAYSKYQQNQLSTSQPDFFENNIASTASTLNSAKICNTGGFKDTLTICQ